MINFKMVLAAYCKQLNVQFYFERRVSHWMWPRSLSYMEGFEIPKHMVWESMHTKIWGKGNNFLPTTVSKVVIALSSSHEYWKSRWSKTLRLQWPNQILFFITPSIALFLIQTISTELLATTSTIAAIANFNTHTVRYSHSTSFCILHLHSWNCEQVELLAQNYRIDWRQLASFGRHYQTLVCPCCDRMLRV